MTIPTSADAVIGLQRINLRKEVIATILDVIQVGWELALKTTSVADCSDEVCMTECLRDGMREAANKKLKILIVAPGAESKSSDDLRHPDGRTDIPMYLVPVFQNQRDHDPHAIIECKRVKAADAYLSREYVVEGIDRFVSGKYAAKHSNGFMVGYILAGDPSTVSQSINAPNDIFS